jgi:long-chain acyl-CoA synthetase
MIKMLLISPHVTAYNMASLRCVVYGGSPMYEEDIREAIRRFGRIFVQIYGQGEAPMTITYLPSYEHVVEGSPDQTKRLRSAGIARTDVEIRIFDESDREVPHNMLGEIVVRGDIVMEGYWNDPIATGDALRNGWLHTGDVGHIDQKGYLFVMDRKKDMIISGGSNIYPREVEETILEHSAVQEVAVIGVPDPLWGESVKAVVVPKPGAKLTDQEIIAFCRGRIASYKKPRSVEFVESIPKNAYGKVVKREIRQKYWLNADRKI